MSLFNRLYRKHFVSHQEKFIEQHAEFCTSKLNHFTSDDLLKKPDGLYSNSIQIPVKSNLSFINDTDINIVELSNQIAILFFLEHFIELNGITIDDLYYNFSVKLRNSIVTDCSINQITQSLKKESERYKILVKDNHFYPNFLCLYDDSLDVITPEYLDSLFNTFYSIQGYVMLFASYTNEKLIELSDKFLESKKYRIFKEFRDILDGSKLDNLPDSNFKSVYDKFLFSSVMEQKQSISDAFKIIESISTYSGNSSTRASEDYLEFIKLVNSNLLQWESHFLLTIHYIGLGESNSVTNIEILPELSKIIYLEEFRNKR